MTSREAILKALRAARRPFTDWPPVVERVPVVPLADATPAALQAQFVRAAEALGCTVTCLPDADRALAHVLALIAPDTAILSWDAAHIPLPGWDQALAQAGIAIRTADPAVRVGVTGADAALAGTGSLVLASGPGKPRLASLLPPVHIAVITAEQLVPDLEQWIAAQRADGFAGLRRASSTVVISGPSRTGDIAQILVRGVHGPGTVHIVLIDGAAPSR